jgi:S1-C subfamily serine protease
VRLGDVAVVVGNQVAGAASVSQGIIRGTAASVAGAAGAVGELLETTAPVGAGSSGSAVVNTAGQVIGMTTLGLAGSTGFAVAVPSNQVASSAQNARPASHPYLGVALADDPAGGALIQGVAAGSPAALAGMQAGWTITSLNGTSVANAASASQVLGRLAPSQHVDIALRVPGGASKTISAVLGSA